MQNDYTDSDKRYLFETMEISRAVAKLSIPTIISSLVMMLYNLTDTYFVGYLNDPVQNAAVTLSAPLLMAFNAVNNLFGVGSSSMMSRALGRGDYNTVRQSSSFGFYGAAAIGMIFAVMSVIFRYPLLNLIGADYKAWSVTNAYVGWTVTFGAVPAILNVVLAYMVRAEGNSFHASIGTMSGCLINMILDPVFILPWGLAMGAEGAGVATFLSNCAACIYFFILLYAKRGKTFISLSLKKLRLRREVVMGILAVGIPASIQNLLNVTGMTILNQFTAGFGADAVAAMGIAQKINTIPIFISQGLSQGLIPLISYNYSSGDIQRMKKTVIFDLKIALVIMTAAGVLFYIGAQELMGFFIETEQVIAYGTMFLRGFCLGLPFICVDFLAIGIFQATGMGIHALVFSVLRKVVLEIPALIILNRVYPLYGLAYAQGVTEFILAIAVAVVLANMFRSLLKKREG